jgi:hypothetical protein
MDRCWTAVGPLLGRCWTAVGPLLDRCWTAVGPLLGRCWTAVGPLLDRCWAASLASALHTASMIESEGKNSIFATSKVRD